MRRNVLAAAGAAEDETVVRAGDFFVKLSGQIAHEPPHCIRTELKVIAGIGCQCDVNIRRKRESVIARDCHILRHTDPCALQAFDERHRHDVIAAGDRIRHGKLAAYQAIGKLLRGINPERPVEVIGRIVVQVILVQNIHVRPQPCLRLEQLLRPCQAVDLPVTMHLHKMLDDLAEIIVIVVLSTVKQGIVRLIDCHDIPVRFPEQRLDTLDHSIAHVRVILDVNEPAERFGADQIIDFLFRPGLNGAANMKAAQRRKDHHIASAGICLTDNAADRIGEMEFG